MNRKGLMACAIMSVLLIAGCNTPQTSGPGTGATAKAAAPKQKECWRWVTQSDGTRFCDRYDAPDY